MVFNLVSNFSFAAASFSLPGFKLDLSVYN